MCILLFLEHLTIAPPISPFYFINLAFFIQKIDMFVKYAWFYSILWLQYGYTLWRVYGVENRIVSGFNGRILICWFPGIIPNSGCSIPLGTIVEYEDDKSIQ